MQPEATHTLMPIPENVEMLPEEASYNTGRPHVGVSGEFSGIDCEAQEGIGDVRRGTPSEDASDCASDDEAMGQTPAPKSSTRRSQASFSASQESPSQDEPMGQTP